MSFIVNKYYMMSYLHYTLIMLAGGPRSKISHKLEYPFIKVHSADIYLMMFSNSNRILTTFPCGPPQVNSCCFVIWDTLCFPLWVQTFESPPPPSSVNRFYRGMEIKCNQLTRLLSGKLSYRLT